MVRLLPFAAFRSGGCFPFLLLLAVAAVPAHGQANPGLGGGHPIAPLPIRPPGPPQPGTVVSIEKYAAPCKPKRLCQQAFADALNDARAFFAHDPFGRYTISIPAGVYDLSDETSPLPHRKGMVDFTGIRPRSGSLTLKGAGSGQTTLMTANETTQFFGTDISNITIEGMTLKRKSMTTTQGTVVKVAPGEVTIRIPPGYPLVKDMFNPESGNGNWLRAYDNTNPLDPHIDTDPSNEQIAIASKHPPTCDGRLCTIFLAPGKVVPALYTKPHEIVGVKSFKGGGAYYFNDNGKPEGSNVGFKDIVWYDEGRGIWLNIKNVFVLNCAIRRRPPVEGQMQAMSTPGGGPQIAYNIDHPAMNAANLVDHFTAESTGDDSLAIFNDMSSSTVFSNTNISNSFARTINLFRSCHVKLENNIGKFCSPQMDYPKQYKGCITDTSHPGPTPCGPSL